MSKGNTYETDLLGLLLNATPIANVADNAASAPLTNLYVALHTADPGEGGDQTTSEVAYTGYARVAIVRSNGSPAWSISAGSASPLAAINFALCTALTGTATHFSIGSASSGAGKIFYSGTVTPNISISNGVTPQLPTTSTITED